MGEQIKVLFVVYRTEWWGCFDSYCRQECCRENTICYVMPVPRYERDADTYEVNPDKKYYFPEKLAPMLPQEAILADYRNFSLEQGFDRIYIHNPYDNCSRMDTVESDFYSMNLKQYTQKLIYVSHFIGLIPGNFGYCRAYDYVDAIFLQSNRAKYSLDVKYDKKTEVVPSGIPEYLDRLSAQMESEKNAANIAKETDTRKKLLYCVSFADLHNGTEKQLRKMRDIFEYVKRNQNIQLIFRPDEDIHFRSKELDEAIWVEYQRLVAYFQKNKIGIYDESLDLYRAAVEADGILCTSHPMAALFSVQGKYVLHIDTAHRIIPSKEDRCIPCLWAVEVVEKGEEIELWFVPERTRLICKMVIPSGVTAGVRKGTAKKKIKDHMAGPRVEVVAEVPDEVMAGVSYINVIKIENRIYLSPHSSDGIWKCDLNKNYFSKQYLPKADKKSNITSTIVWGKYLYMIPRTYPGIIKYDTETEFFEIIDGWLEEIECYVAPESQEDPYFIWGVQQEENILYMVSAKCDMWMEFNMDSDSWKLKPMKLSGRKFIHMVKDGNWVWLFPFCGDEIILWNHITGESCKVCNTINIGRNNAPYIQAFDLGNFIAAFPQQDTDHVLMIEKPNFEKSADSALTTLLRGIKIKEIKGEIPCGQAAYLSEYLKGRKIGCSFLKKLNNGMILVYEYYDGCFLLLDNHVRVIRKIPCRLPAGMVRQEEDLMWRYAQHRSRFKGELNEGWSLPVMMEYFVRHCEEDRENIRKYYRKTKEVRRFS